LLDARWHEEDRTGAQLAPNYVHAFCLIADSVESLSKEEQLEYQPKLRDTWGKLGELRQHPYIEERGRKLLPDEFQ
jgi:hypothetical protein